jgi:hypothetical protein
MLSYQTTHSAHIVRLADCKADATAALFVRQRHPHSEVAMVAMVAVAWPDATLTLQVFPHDRLALGVAAHPVRFGSVRAYCGSQEKMIGSVSFK